MIVRWLIALTSLTWTSMPRAEEAIAVITGLIPPSIGLDRSNLQDIFLKRIRVDDARAALVPLNLSPTHPIRMAFSLSLWGERPEAMQRYWTERYFHGISPPYSVDSQESMLRFVANTPGAIGYVLTCRVDSRVHVAAKLAIPAELATQILTLCNKSERQSAIERRE
jgi:ABC-type phosphate transport system substrate-binding protein